MTRQCAATKQLTTFYDAITQDETYPMGDWILRHIGGLLDWLLVFLFVAALVFGCQLMINFMKPPEDEPGDEEDSS